MTNWSKCPAVESVPGRVSGNWVFKETRLPVYALFENLAEGATIHDFIEWFDGAEESEVKAVLEHVVQDLRAKVSDAHPVSIMGHQGSCDASSSAMMSKGPENAAGIPWPMGTYSTGLKKPDSRS